MTDKNIIGTKEYEIQKRKDKRHLKTMTDDEQQKDRLNKEILDSEIKQKKEEIKQKEQQLQEQINEIFYRSVDNQTNLYKKLGLVSSARDLNRRLSRNPTYFQSNRYNKNNPTIDILNDLIADLMVIENNLDMFIDRTMNKRAIYKELRDLIIIFSKIKQRTLKC